MKRLLIMIVVDAVLAVFALTLGVSPVWARAVAHSRGAAVPTTLHTGVALTIAVAGMAVAALAAFVIASRVAHRDPLTGARPADVPEQVAAGSARPAEVARPNREPKAA